MSISSDLHKANLTTTDKEPLYTDQKRMQVFYSKERAFIYRLISSSKNTLISKVFLQNYSSFESLNSLNMYLCSPKRT